jgi:hypothetical protein
VSTDDGLHDVGAVETVHAVSSEDAFLDGFLGGPLARILGQFHMEIPIILELMIHQIH